MTIPTELLVWNLGAVLVPMLVLWGLSVPLRNVSIVDLFWGAGFVVTAWVALDRAPDPGWRSVVIAVAVSVWGGRLSLYLGWRNLGHGEDRRYQDMRARQGSSFPITSLLSVFLLQGILIWVVSMPVQIAIADGADAMHAVHWAGLAIVALGILCESLADIQLARFKANPANKSAVMNRGLWRYSRHPNYFGDFLVWIGLFALCWGGIERSWTVLGPAVMTFFLLRVSGVTLLEHDIGERRPAYRDYIRQTSAFFPLPPKSSS